MTESTAPDPVHRALDNVLIDIAALRSEVSQQPSQDQYGWLLALHAIEDLVARRLLVEVDR